MSDWVSSAISAGGSMISSLIGVNAAKKQAARQQTYNKELAEIQNQYNIAQWNRENAYNLPIAQIERLQEAGLNPNLVYGNPSNTAAASPFLTSGNAANLQGLPHLGTAFQNSIDTYLKLKQADNISADTANKQVENRILTTNAELQEAIKEGNIALNGWAVKMAEVQYDSAKQQYDFNEQYNPLQLDRMRGDLKSIDLANQELSKKLDQMDILTDTMSQELAIKKIEAFFAEDRAKMELRRMTAEINSLNANSHFTEEQTKSVAYNLFMRKFNQSNELSINDSQAALARANLKGVEMNNNMISFELDTKREFKYVDEALKIGDVFVSGLTKLAGSATKYMSSSSSPQPQSPRAKLKRRSVYEYSE